MTKEENDRIVAQSDARNALSARLLAGGVASPEEIKLLGEGWGNLAGWIFSVEQRLVSSQSTRDADKLSSIGGELKSRIDFLRMCRQCESNSSKQEIYDDEIEWMRRLMEYL